MEPMSSLSPLGPSGRGRLAAGSIAAKRSELNAGTIGQYTLTETNQNASGNGAWFSRANHATIELYHGDDFRPCAGQKALVSTPNIITR